jgi:hypothetical protein
MVVYFSAGIFLSTLPDITTGVPFDLAFLSKALCSHFFVMSADRLEKHSRFFRIQSGKT